jgi:predicted type IV restriction endonuclease
MDSSDVADYVEQSKSILEESPQMNEENTKAKLIQPFISLLGWDMFSTNVELEYPVQVGVGTKKVDYALMVENSPKVFIEAKGRDTAMTDSEVNQLRSYMRQELDVKWGIITNGEEFEIFRKGTSAGTDGEISLGRFSLTDLRENPGVLEIISKEAITSGESDDWIQRIEETRAAIDHLQEHKGRVASEVADVVTDEVGEVSTLQLETESKEFVDTLIRSLEAQADLVAKHGGGGEGGTGSGTGGSEWKPQVGADAVAGKISRAELEGPSDASVVVFPSQESGLSFLKENNAWGFVRMGQTPDYAAVYVTRTAREVRYVAEVKEIIGSEEAELAKPLGEYTGEEATFDTDKKVVVFEPGTLYGLADPIPFGEEYPQSHRYTTLGKLKEATVTDDLFD